MGVQKRTRKFAQVKRIIGQRDARLKKPVKEPEKDKTVREVPQASSALFFTKNTALSPPYSIIVDTNFISRSVQLKLDMLPTFMDLLYAKCNLIITDCVIGEMEKLGPKYSIALRIAKDPRWERVSCSHQGLYADDCIVDRVTKHRVYLVATNDRDLKRRIRKIPGVPIITASKGKYAIERLPDLL
ncbi:MAG: rRNA-processing protein fcf1 [Claussenomyces sp. TS43310]|nr:MAG: rRNA-processing protein fcf1 [Claussenomyces sp. TS43310]